MASPACLRLSLASGSTSGKNPALDHQPIVEVLQCFLSIFIGVYDMQGCGDGHTEVCNTDFYAGPFACKVLRKNEPLSTQQRSRLTACWLLDRPLIVMMVHDPTADTPRCRLHAEDSEEFGSPIYPETAVAEAIREMTEAHLRQVGGTVSDKPIVLRAEYAFCPNLTIIDTPGFILKARPQLCNFLVVFAWCTFGKACMLAGIQCFAISRAGKAR